MIELWEHQAKAAKEIMAGNLPALWWEPRCGKTLAAIAGTDDGDRLIVCPNSVKGVWKNDLALYGQDAFIWGQGKKPKERPRNVIVNYETLWRTDLLGYGYDSVIFDESHRLANHRTKLFAHCFSYLQALCSARVVLLSGSPCPESWAQLIAQSIIAVGNYAGVVDPWTALRDGWVYDEASYKWKELPGTAKKAQGIFDMLGHKMTQAEAGISTKKLYRIIPVALGKKEENAFLTAMNELAPDGARFGQLSQSYASGRSHEGDIPFSSKLDAVMNYAVELGKPVIVLANFTSSLEYLLAGLKARGVTVELMHGGDDGAEFRTKVVEQFNAGKVQVIVAQVAVVKVGLNFSKADTLIFAENSWSGEARIQAEERCTVRGKEAVEIIDFVAESGLSGLGEIDLAIRTAVKNKQDFNAQNLRRKVKKGITT